LRDRHPTRPPVDQLDKEGFTAAARCLADDVVTRAILEPGADSLGMRANDAPPREVSRTG